MEPLAPGTEDDPPIAYSSLNKQENEQERLLKIKAILPNGKYANVFELNYVNGAERWFCNACKCPVMGRVYQHENGKRHCINLAMMNRHKDKFPQQEDADELSLQVAPGEPVPPGFEGEVEKTAQIQERLNGFKVGPLVALEYLLELQDYDPSKEPFYLCILCDKRGDPRTVLTHLASYNHISQYLQKHFPTCYRALTPYITKQYKRNWQSTLLKLAEAIEVKFGRMKPMPVEKDKFEKDKMHYLQMICKGKHFSEQMGCTFEELIVHEELTKVYEDEKSAENDHMSSINRALLIQKSFQKKSPSPPVVARPSKKSKAAGTSGATFTTKSASSSSQFRRRSLSSVSSISSSDLSEFEVDRNRKVRGKGRTSPRRYRSPSPRREEPYRRERRMPWQKSNYSRQKGDTDSRSQIERNDKLDEYKKLAKAIENDMEKTLRQHEKNPEKHPQYNDEWKKFWNKRYKELQAEGVDVSKHDFKPEWIKFWNKRMVDIHQDEIKSKKDALRKRLGLPEEPAPICFRITGKIRNDSTGKNSPKTEVKPVPMAAQPDHDPEVIVIEDNNDETKSSKRSHSPWESEPTPKVYRSREKSKDRRSYSRDRSPSVDKTKGRRNASRERQPDRFSRERQPDRFSRERQPDRSSRERRISRERRSSREKISRDRLSRDKNSRERVLRRSRSRSRDRDRYSDKKREYRESSYERDMRGRERVRVVSDLPWEREKAYRKEYDEYYKPPAVMRDVTRKPVIQPTAPIIPAEDDDNVEVNVVSVLRLLTALEERLGSLGPKVIDLLAQALAMEKNEANGSENLLDNDINCVLFETVKEKLKGQLLAGFVDIIQERAFKIAIKKTASLIYLAGQRKKEKERLQPKTEPVSVAGVGVVDKAAIAKQIANALILQGKTDVSQDELEQLINAVVGMAEASKNSSKPITTATFLEQISEGTIRKESPVKREIVEIGKIAEEPIKSPVKFTPIEVKKEVMETPPPSKASSSNMDHLSDSDLQTLLQNFKDLSTDEQHNLINYLKKLEAHEPDRVERLRKFVNLGSNVNNNPEKVEVKVEPVKKEDNSGRESPFSHRQGGVNPAADDHGTKKGEPDDKGKDSDHCDDGDHKPVNKIHLDSDEEDYTFDDVVQAVSKNVKAKEIEKERRLVEETISFDSKKVKPEVDLSDAKALISNLMSNISKNNSVGSTINLLGLGASSGTTTTVTSSAEFTKTLNSLPINMDSLANIVGNVQKMTQENRRDVDFNLSKINFQPPLTNKLNQGIGHDLRMGEGSGRQMSGNMMGVRAVGPTGSMSGGMMGQMNHGAANYSRQDRPIVQYPQKNVPYGGGGNNYSQNFPSQQNIMYPNIRGTNPGIFDQRARFGNNSNNNPRFPANFGGNQFNNRPGPAGNNFNNRW